MTVKDRWVTLVTFFRAHEAHLVKTKLESEGIKVQIADEHLVSIQPFYSPALGGVKLNVLQSEFETAKAILEQFQSS